MQVCIIEKTTENKKETKNDQANKKEKNKSGAYEDGPASIEEYGIEDEEEDGMAEDADIE